MSSIPQLGSTELFERSLKLAEENRLLKEENERYVRRIKLLEARAEAAVRAIYGRR